MMFLASVLWFYLWTTVTALRSIYPPAAQLPNPILEDSPVFVTPYLESGQVELAKNMTQVLGIANGVESYAGYFTVDKTYNSNLYFWYFPAETSKDSAPVVLWLQGGPGASSLYGLFEETGPFYVDTSGNVKKREHYWSKVLNVIYIDNPVGTGFSFTEDERGFARDEIKVGQDLYSALLQFFQLFPELKENDFIVSGESYAGKYVPAISYAIHTNNKINKQQINLKGLAIGDGLCDPVNMVTGYGEYLYQIGILDTNGRDQFQVEENLMTENIKSGKFKEAFMRFDRLLDSDLTPYASLFYNLTGFNFYYNYLHDKDYSPYGDETRYVQREDVRLKIHVGDRIFNSGHDVETHLLNDVMKSVKPWIEELLEHYRIVFYNGQLDVIVAYPLTVNFLKTLEWSGTDEYKTAERKQWRVDGQLAGYTKTVGNLTEILVRNAGHMVPFDQPLWAMDLISRFAFNKPFQ